MGVTAIFGENSGIKRGIIRAKHPMHMDKAKYITTADAADGYWLAPLDPETSYLTAFCQCGRVVSLENNNSRDSALS